MTDAARRARVVTALRRWYDEQAALLALMGELEATPAQQELFEALRDLDRRGETGWWKGHDSTGGAGSASDGDQ